MNPSTTSITTTGTGLGAVTDGHTGWDCPTGASLIARVTGPGPGRLPAHHGCIYVCLDHRAQAEARIAAAGHTPDTDPAPHGHRWNPWPCGHITTYGTDGPQLAEVLTIPAEQTPADRIRNITARHLNATAGPWGTYDDGSGRIDVAAGMEHTGHGYRCRREIAQTIDGPTDNDPAHETWTEDQDLAQSARDAEFIAQARVDVPWLLEQLAAVTRQRDVLAEQLHAWEGRP